MTVSKLENVFFIMYDTEFQASFSVAYVRRVYPCISISRMCCILVSMVENRNLPTVLGENLLYRFSNSYPAIWTPFVGHGRMDIWHPHRVFLFAFKNMGMAVQFTSYKTSGWNTKNTYLVPLKDVTQLWILEAWNIFFLNSMETPEAPVVAHMIVCHWLLNVGSKILKTNETGNWY